LTDIILTWKISPDAGLYPLVILLRKTHHGSDYSVTVWQIIYNRVLSSINDIDRNKVEFDLFMKGHISTYNLISIYLSIRYVPM